jgi:hypothetical protein
LWYPKHNQLDTDFLFYNTPLSILLKQKFHIVIFSVKPAPKMKHTDAICIENMVVHGIVGAKPRERVKPQALVVSMTLHTDFSFVAKTDYLADAEIDYA